MLYSNCSNAELDITDFFGETFSSFLRNQFEKDYFLFDTSLTANLRLRLISAISDIPFNTLVSDVFESNSVGIRVVMNGEEVDFQESQTTKEKIDEVINRYGEGYTIAITNLGRLNQTFSDIQARIGNCFPARINMNVYFSSSCAPNGFSSHFDTHDVFALQVSGRKRWEIEKFSCLRQEKKRFKVELGKESDTRQLTLEPGQILYVPRGGVHFVEPLNQDSIHITIGVTSITMAEVIGDIVTVAAKRDDRLLQSFTWSSFMDSDVSGLTEINREVVYDGLFSLVEALKNEEVIGEALLRSVGRVIATFPTEKQPEGISTKTLGGVKCVLKGCNLFDENVQLPNEVIVGDEVKIQDVINKFTPSLAKLVADTRRIKNK